jgi:hypothetical protein
MAAGVFAFSYALSQGNVERSTKGTLVLSAWVALVISTLQRPKLAAATASNGVSSMGWRPSHRFGVPTALAGPVAVLVAIADRPAGSEGVFLLTVMEGLFVVGWLGMQFEFRERLELSDDKLERISPWTGTRKSIPWKSVRHIRFAGNSQFLVKSDTGRLVRVALRMDGIGDFAITALNRIPDGVLKSAGDVPDLLQRLAAKRLQLEGANQIPIP